jgi:hypothetical protein
VTPGDQVIGGTFGRLPAVVTRVHVRRRGWPLTATVTATRRESRRISADSSGREEVLSYSETTLGGPPRTGGTDFVNSWPSVRIRPPAPFLYSDGAAACRQIPPESAPVAVVVETTNAAAAAP